MTNVLPKGGGTLDQDPEFMRDLRIIASLEASGREIKNSKEKIKKKIEEEIKSGRATRKV